MKTGKFLAVICLASGLAYGAESTVATHFANAVTKAFLAIVNTGGDVWTKLGQGQALSILQSAESGAATLESKKNDLRAAMLSSDQDQSPLNVSEKTEEMKKSVREIRDRLTKFCQEVDAAASPIGTDVRVEVDKAETGKVIELDKVGYLWTSRRHEEAIKSLDLAIKDLQRMRKGIACLKESIERKKPTCNPTTLEPLTDH